MLGWREHYLGLAHVPFLKREGLGVYLSDPVFRNRLSRPPEEDMDAAIRMWAAGFSDLSHTWKDLHFLRTSTSLPIILKGILHTDDAIQAIEHGADGIVVSNHDGQQVDRCIAALEALPGVVDAVADRIPVLFNSGIRCGADVFKSIAMGAKAVLVGRPYLWELAVAGSDGVKEVINRLMADFDVTMVVSGCR